MMDFKLAFWTLALCAGMLVWLKWDVDNMEIYYEWHDFLLTNNSANHESKIEPRQLIDLAKIINVTQDYVNQTNSLERLHDLVYQTNLAGAFPHYLIYSERRAKEMAGWPVSNQTFCGQQLAWINHRLAERPDFQLLRGQLGRELTSLMDSFGKFQSGTYAGLTSWIGSYSLCQRTSLRGGEIKTRYCLASMRFRSWPEANEERVYPKSRIRIGACLPETCDSLSYDDTHNRHEIETLIKLQLPEFYKENLVFEDLYCLPDERSPLRKLSLGARLLLAMMAGWILIIIVASTLQAIATRARGRQAKGAPTGLIKTKPLVNQQQPAIVNQKATPTLEINFADCNKQRSGVREPKSRAHLSSRFACKLIGALAIQNTWRRFVADRFGERAHQVVQEGGRLRLDMRSLDFIKVLLMLAILIAHACLLLVFQFRSIVHWISLTVNEEGRLLASVGRAVDTFFLVFGLLVAYNLIKRFPDSKKLGNPLVWLVMNVNLMIRVAPLFALAYWFARLIAPHLGDGPWWDYGTYRYTARGLCMREPWFKSIPHLGQWGSPRGAACVTPAWFLVSYAQIGLIVPLITYLIYGLPREALRWLLIAYLLAISCLQLMLKFHRQTAIRPEAFMQYGGFLLALLEKFQSTGTMAALGRVGCVAFGCHLGYLLRMYEIGAIGEWPRWLVSRAALVGATLLQVLILALPVFGYWLSALTNHTSTIWEFVAGYSITMILWILLLGVQMICLFTTHNRTRFARLASHWFWRSFNRLGFCIFLIHFEVLQFGLTFYEQAPSIGFRGDGWKLAAFGLLITIPISLLVHLLFEAPMTQLLRLLIASRGKKTTQATEQKVTANLHVGVPTWSESTSELQVSS